MNFRFLKQVIKPNPEALAPKVNHPSEMSLDAKVVFGVEERQYLLRGVEYWWDNSR